MDFNEQVSKLRDGLVQQRDELFVQLNLAKLEAREEWEKAEEQMEQWQSKAKSVLEESKEASEDILAGLSMLGDEIKAAYERIKRRL